MNPYTIEDVLNCKTISQEHILSSFRSIVKFDALSNPRKFCGNPILYHYQFKNLLNCRREGKLTIEEISKDSDKWNQLWKHTLDRNQSKSILYSLLLSGVELSVISLTNLFQADLSLASLTRSSKSVCSGRSSISEPSLPFSFS